MPRIGHRADGVKDLVPYEDKLKVISHSMYWSEGVAGIQVFLVSDSRVLVSDSRVLVSVSRSLVSDSRFVVSDSWTCLVSDSQILVSDSLFFCF